MYSIHVLIIASLLLHGIDGSLSRRRRQQTYGNSNNPSAGYNNYPANTNLYGTNLNNQASKDLYGNPMGPGNPGNSLNMGLPNPQQQQQQQQQQPPPQQQPLYGANGVNPSFTGTGLYSPNTMNQVGGGNMPMRDNNGNLIPGVQGSPGSSFYSPSNSQMGYPGIANKDAYNPSSNPNTNNQYGVNNNNNNNPYPNSNTYLGQQMPNTNNAWPNTNNNQQHSSAGNNWSQNRDLNTNNNAHTNPNSPYFYNNSAFEHDDIMFDCYSFNFLPYLLTLRRVNHSV